MNHLSRRRYLAPCLLALLCLGLLGHPQAAVQGFADGVRLCMGSLLPALFPFLVICEMLSSLSFSLPLLRNAGRRLGLQSEAAAMALLASWLGGYAICAKMTAALCKEGKISSRDGTLLLLLGCCSGPGFVVGYIGGLLLHNTSLGLLLYGMQLAANFLAAACCFPFLPPAGAASIPQSAARKAVSLPQAISAAVSSCLNLCGCVIFFRILQSVLLVCLPLPEKVTPFFSAACEVTAGCAAFASGGGRLGLYGICLALSLLGFSVWSQQRLLLQGQISLRLLFFSRCMHAVFFLPLVWAFLWTVPQQAAVYRSLSARVIPLLRLSPDAAVVAGVFLCALLYKGRKNFYNKI